jgi:hypothetical protein
MKKVLLFAVVMCGGMVIAESTSNPWRLTVGPAWRSRVKASISGNAQVDTVSASHTVTYDKDVAGKTSWGIGDVTTVPDTDSTAPAGSTLYAAESVRTETIVSPGSGSGRIDASDEDSPLGFKMGIGYDFYDDGHFSVGLDFKFAAFWDMESQVSGSAGGGTVRVKKDKDYFLFENGPYPNDTDFSYSLPNVDPYLPYREAISDTTTSLPSSAIRAMVTSDLYQFGVGPRFGWHVCNWLDAYAGVSALCNIAAVDFDVNGRGESATECRFGVGTDVGLAAWFSENVGFYAEVGYEWIDEPTVRNGGMSAELDYSSLIVSTGVIVRF